MPRHHEDIKGMNKECLFIGEIWSTFEKESSFAVDKE